MSIVIVCNSRSEKGPLESVIAALPEARVVGHDVGGMSPPSALSCCVSWFSDDFRNLGASLVILLGDRYETLAAALAATFLRIPIAHVHGGETTTGAFDDAFRHSITHLTQQSGGVHFCATIRAKDVIENLVTPYSGVRRCGNIHVVGAPGLDGVPGNSAKRDRKLILATYHPETMAEDYGLANCEAMLRALREYKDYEIIFCGVNSDPGAERINETIDAYCRTADDQHVRIMSGLSHAEYIYFMQSAALVVGNSSAGVIEAPWVGVPSVNIGSRQNGRETAASVWSAHPDHISDSIEHALGWRGPWPPIYRGGAAEKIRAVLEKEGYLK